MGERTCEDLSIYEHVSLYLTPVDDGIGSLEVLSERLLTDNPELS